MGRTSVLSTGNFNSNTQNTSHLETLSSHIALTCVRYNIAVCCMQTELHRPSACWTGLSQTSAVVSGRQPWRQLPQRVGSINHCCCSVFTLTMDLVILFRVHSVQIRAASLVRSRSHMIDVCLLLHCVRIVTFRSRFGLSSWSFTIAEYSYNICDGGIPKHWHTHMLSSVNPCHI